MAKTRIFLTGATGYIGGTVLLRFLGRPDFQDLKVTALVRSEEKAKKFNDLGVETVIGSLADSSLLEKAASEADIVIHTADSGGLDAVNVLLRGLEQQHATTGKVPSFIHTSGTGVFCDNAAGMYAYESIYDDEDTSAVERVPAQLHLVVAQTVIDADKKGFVRTYVVFPSLVYGLATGKLVDLGLQNKYSMQIPYLISIALDRSQGGMVGKGKNIWPNVHIDDIADLYITVYDGILSGSNIGHGREGTYFGENGEMTLHDVVTEISKVLVKLGKSSSDQPTTFTDEELVKYFAGIPIFGANSRCRGNRSRAIGWNPKKTTADLFASIGPEVDSLLVSSEYAEILARFSAFFARFLKRA